MARFDWVLFDADDTLYDFSLGERTALHATLYGAYGQCPESWAAHYKTINRRLFAQLERQEIDVAYLRKQRFIELLDHIGLEGDPVHLGETYVDHLSQQAQLIDGTEAVLDALHGLYRMAIVTNGMARTQRTRFAQSGLDRYFDALFVSDEVGAYKPDTRFFDHVFAAIGQPVRERVIIVGDSLHTDIEGGLRYGLRTCWLNRTGAPASNAPHHEITHLSELLELI